MERPCGNDFYGHNSLFPFLIHFQTTFHAQTRLFDFCQQIQELNIKEQILCLVQSYYHTYAIIGPLITTKGCMQNHRSPFYIFLEKSKVLAFAKLTTIMPGCCYQSKSKASSPKCKKWWSIVMAQVLPSFLWDFSQPGHISCNNVRLLIRHKPTNYVYLKHKPNHKFNRKKEKGVWIETREAHSMLLTETFVLHI